MNSTPWFRFYSEALNDRKILRICRETGHCKALVIGTWATILALASDSPERGMLLFTEDIPLTFEDLALETGLDDGPLDELLGAFAKFEMLTCEDGIYYVKNWDKRQFASDSSTERVRDWRKRQREKAAKEEGTPGDSENVALQGGGDETLLQRFSNAPETETETETETEKPISSTSADYQAIRQRWIELFPDKPKPRSDNGSLQSKVRTRLQKAHFRDNWETALVRASRSSFLHESGWFDLGWFLKNDNHYEKCLNGNYDDKSVVRQPQERTVNVPMV